MAYVFSLGKGRQAGRFTAAANDPNKSPIHTGPELTIVLVRIGGCGQIIAATDRPSETPVKRPQTTGGPTAACRRK